MIRTRIRPLAIAAAAGALLLAATPAEAGKAVKSKVKITKIGRDGARGKVISKKAKCERRRTVVLVNADDYGTDRVGKTKTKRAGKWSIDKRLNSQFGSYFAKVKRKELRSGKVCKGDESPLRDLRHGEGRIPAKIDATVLGGELAVPCTRNPL